MRFNPPAPEESMVALRGIAKAFGATVALAGIDLDLAAGEALALMGANGAGKSTLVAILGGLIRPDAGSMRIADHVFAPNGPQDSRQAGIAVVHQATERAGVAGLSVADALVLDEMAEGRGPFCVTWSAFKAKNPDVVEKAHFGAVNDTTASTIDDQAKAALRANPGITVVFAPYDEFARGTKLAINELNLAGKVKVYSADISSADIGEITEPGSPWVATVATNPAVVGAVSIRAAALAVAGQDPGHQITVQPTLLTQAALREAGIKTVADLNAEIPAFGHSEAATAPWIPQPH